MNSLPIDIVGLLLEYLDRASLACFIKTNTRILGAIRTKLFKQLEHDNIFKHSPYEFEMLVRKLVEKDGKAVILGHCFGRQWNAQKEDWDYRYYKGGIWNVNEKGSIAGIFRSSDKFKTYLCDLNFLEKSEPGPEYSYRTFESGHIKRIIANIHANRLSLNKNDSDYYKRVSGFGKNLAPEFYFPILSYCDYYDGSVSTLRLT